MKAAKTFPRPVSILQVFYDAYCGTDGKMPACSGCPEWRRTPGGNPVCIHPEHPENKSSYREMVKATMLQPADETKEAPNVQ